MKRLMSLMVLGMALALGLLWSAEVGAVHDQDADSSRSVTAFDTVVNDFTDQNEGAFGAIVKVGYHQSCDDIRIGAAAHIGVSPDSYDKYLFTISVISRDKEGNVVAKHESAMSEAFAKVDSHKWGVYTIHAKPAAGTYTVTASLTASTKDGSVNVLLDRGKVTTYTVE